MKFWRYFIFIFLIATSAVASPRESLEMTNGWKAAYCERIDEQPSADAWGDYPRRDPWWQSVDFATAASKPSKKPEDYNGMWLKKDQVVPATWAGGRIRIELPVPIRRCDGVVFVNGRKAGDVLRPGGALDITAFVRCGETNAIALFLTQDGSGTQRGVTKVNRWDNGIPRGLMAFPRLLATDSAFVSDVFADPSVQKHELTLEVEVDADREAEARLEARILDPDGGTVKTLTRPVTLKPGINRFKPQIPWSDPHFWDFGDGYLYTCEVNLTTGDSKDVYPAFRFGFRELWREGRNLVMNGRPLHMRTCYGYNCQTRNAMRFLRSIGYTVLAINHDVNGFPQYPARALDSSDELGVGMILSCGNLGNLNGMEMLDNADAQEAYEAYIRHFHRMFRNHPSLVACYVSQMIICDIKDFPPDRIGQTVGVGDRDKLINIAREINRKYNPDILYYSHADGPNGDMSSGNLYFNWTPQQEMDEWLSEWADNGIYPWHGAEFDAPYGGGWWFGGGFGGAEHLARQYGEEAYEQEPVRALEATRDLSASNRNSHWGWSDVYNMEADWPFYWEWRRNLVSRINRHWRGYGLNGGLIWFNLQAAYGNVTNAFGWSDRPDTSQRYDDISDPFDSDVRPGWVNPAYDIYRLGNQNFCGYLAGSPEQADKTHAFFSGEKVEKQAAFIWDGHGKQTFSANWRAIMDDDNRVIASGRLMRTMEPGAIAFEQFSFPAPQVDSKGSGHIELAYGDGTKDAFPFEVYPRKTAAKPVPFKGVRLAVFDPEGEDEKMLTALGIPHRTVASPTEIGDATHLLIGRRALEQSSIGVDPERLGEGMKILVMPQSPAVWASLGFQVQDAMSRTVFLRDKTNSSFVAISPDMLCDWRGTPDYGEPYRPVMQHSTPRGPRGSRRHTVAGLVLQVPDKAGFVPLIDGGYDLNYAALMRFEYGKGAVTACTLDLEGRVEADPAATEVARAVLSDFLSYRRDESKAIACDGDAATKLAAELGFATSGTGDVTLVGGDGKTDWSALRAKAEAGATVCVYANAALAKAAGFELEPRQFYRAALEMGSLFRCFTPSMLRWRDALKADALTMAGGDSANAVIAADGLIAQMTIGQGRVVFCQVDPIQLDRRYAEKPGEEAVAADTRWLMDATRHFMEKIGASEAGRRNGFEVQTPWWSETGRDVVARCGVARGGTNGVLMVIGPSRRGAVRRQSTWAYVRQSALEGKTVLVVNGTKIAEEAGFVMNGQVCLDELDARELGVEGMGESRNFAGELPVYRFRHAPEGFAITDGGWVASGSVGEGRVVFLQLDPLAFDRLGEDWGRMRRSAEISEQRTFQMFSRLLLNLGAEPSRDVAKRVLSRAGASAFKPLGAMYVLGPFAYGDRTDAGLMDRTGSEPGEAMAKAGDFNPNVEIPLPQGGTANWRPTLIPDGDGMIDLGRHGSTNGLQVFYGICPVSREQAGTALLRFGSEFRGRVWCNGRLVLNAEKGVDSPLYEVRVQLGKGDNTLAFKLASGRGRGRFWGLIEREGRLKAPASDANSLDMGFYLHLLTGEDPDRYVYW